MVDALEFRLVGQEHVLLISREAWQHTAVQGGPHDWQKQTQTGQHQLCCVGADHLILFKIT